MSTPHPGTPQRYATAKATLWVDWGMTWFIKGGGLAVIVAVFGIFVFILWQVLPLFRSASVTATTTVDLPADIKPADVVGVLSDEWGELPLLVERDGTATFIPLPPRIDASGHSAKKQAEAADAKKPAAPRAPQVIDLKLGDKPVITTSGIDHRRQRVIVGTADGRIAVRTVTYESAFVDGARQVNGSVASDITLTLGVAGKPILSAGYGDSGERKLAAVIQQDGDKRKVLAATLVQARTLLGVGEVKPDRSFDLTDKMIGEPERLLVDERAEGIIVATKSGDLLYFFLSDDGFELRQTFRPFQDQPQPHIASLDYLLGEVSLVLTNDAGLNRIYSLYVKPGETARTFGLTKELDVLPGGAQTYAPSVRNKAFLVTHEKTASLRYGTSASIRWEGQLEYPIVGSVLSAKYHRMMLVGADAKLHTYDLDDPHPESGVKALFGKVWYEGADQAKHDWQSTGGTDDFEPKLSMVPLLIGSLKGTIYALLFALPIAILGAVYTAEFMHPKFKKIVKPVVEIMASLPSVVLGFLAAIWLAPLLVDSVPSLVLVIVALPTAAFAFGWIWSGLPMAYRRHIKPGYEFIAFVPMMIAVAMVAWSLGPVFESLVFRVNGTGDFPNWWRTVTGLSYEQRNSLVVGVMMGFAVIPIIFTIAEDALSNVPAALRSGSLALGASRWETAMRVVVPTASAGIFSAIMIGFGRAIGETMIVVMATGNTPIMGMNIFDGMRTLSANIAVEIPEAPHHGTLYRTLFLGALLLFMLTFLVNTVAEVMRQHLREKYKTV